MNCQSGLEMRISACAVAGRNFKCRFILSLEIKWNTKTKLTSSSIDVEPVHDARDTGRKVIHCLVVGVYVIVDCVHSEKRVTDCIVFIDPHINTVRGENWALVVDITYCYTDSSRSSKGCRRCHIPCLNRDPNFLGTGFTIELL